MGSSVGGILGGLVGGVGGFFLGGPAGASAGYGIGSSLGNTAQNMITGGGASNTANSLADIALQQEQQRQQYATQLQNLEANPSSVTSLPGYQFQLQQGTQAVDRQAAAQGLNGSGNLLTSLDQYSQGLASSFYNNQVKTLAALSGATQNPALLANIGLSGQQATSNANNATSTSLLGLAGQLYGGANTGSNSSLFGSGNSNSSGLSGFTSGTPYFNFNGTGTSGFQTAFS